MNLRIVQSAYPCTIDRQHTISCRKKGDELVDQLDRSVIHHMVDQMAKMHSYSYCKMKVEKYKIVWGTVTKIQVYLGDSGRERHGCVVRMQG